MNIKKLIIFIVGTIIIGSLFSFFVYNNMNSYNDLIKPNLTPPGIVFPIAWFILYTLMGISLYLISETSSVSKKGSYKIYFIQLIVNSLWTLLFFGLDFKLISFIWLIFLIVLVIIMFIKFYKINKIAAYLLIPYIVWLFFAGYLNLSIYLLNR